MERTLGSGGTPAWYAFSVQTGPRNLESALLVSLHHGFRHSAFLSKDSLGGEVGDVIAPYRYKVDAGHRMLDRQCSQPGAVDM